MNKPLFQKRHYVRVAKLLHERKPLLNVAVWRATCEMFADVFSQDNENFQPDRFILACEGGINAKGVGAGINGGPAMRYFQGNTPFESGQARARARRLR